MGDFEAVYEGLSRKIENRDKIETRIRDDREIAPPRIRGPGPRPAPLQAKPRSRRPRSLRDDWGLGRTCTHATSGSRSPASPTTAVCRLHLRDLFCGHVLAHAPHPRARARLLEGDLQKPDTQQRLAVNVFRPVTLVAHAPTSRSERSRCCGPSLRRCGVETRPTRTSCRRRTRPGPSAGRSRRIRRSERRRRSRRRRGSPTKTATVRDNRPAAAVQALW